MIKYNDGKTEKGLMVNNKRQGTWEFYTPAKDEEPGFYHKYDYDLGEKHHNQNLDYGKVSSEYANKLNDLRYDLADGFHRFTKSDGGIVEANYVDGKEQGLCKNIHTDGRIS